jgi:hypothetical protein
MLLDKQGHHSKALYQKLKCVHPFLNRICFPASAPYNHGLATAVMAVCFLKQARCLLKNAISFQLSAISRQLKEL